MAISVTQRPSAWTPAINPVIYKFTLSGGPYTNHRVSVGVFRSLDNTSITNNVDYTFSPNSTGAVTADLSSIFKSYLYKEFVTPSAVNETEDQVGSLEFYIKYQELYTGSATSVQNDSANKFIAVLSALQLGSSANLTNYVPADSTKKFLTKFDIPSLWNGYPFTLSFLFPTGLNLIRVFKQYNSNGVSIQEDYDALNTAYQKALNRLKTPTINALTETARVYLGINTGYSYSNNISPVNSGFDSTLAPWLNDAGGGVWAWVNDGGQSAATAQINSIVTTSAILYNDITYPAWQGSIQVTVNCRVIAGGVMDLKIYGSYLGSAFTQIGSTTSVSNSAYGDKVFTIAVASPIDKIGFRVTYTSGAIATLTNSFFVNTFTVLFAEMAPYTETKTIDIKSACKNPVYLVWKNSVGGDAEWLFEYSQEYTFTYSDGRKANRQVLTARNLTFNEYQALDELNTPGQIFDVAIPELLTTVNKTSKKNDQQVYVVDTAGNKTGVVVISKPTPTATKRVRHSIEIEIEYPYLFL